MKLTIDLAGYERNLLLDSLAKEYKNALKRKWRPSEITVHCASIKSIRNKIVEAELEAKKESGEVGTSSQGV